MVPKTSAVIANAVLLTWFFLDMTGLTLAGHLLVSRSWHDDGVFFLIYLGVFLWFLAANRSGSLALTVWLLLWFLTQFFSHWYYTLVGPGDGKIAYFSGTLKLVPSTTVYVPDLYHILLHTLILVALCLTAIYMVRLYSRGRAPLDAVDGESAQR